MGSSDIANRIAVLERALANGAFALERDLRVIETQLARAESKVLLWEKQNAPWARSRLRQVAVEVPS